MMVVRKGLPASLTQALPFVGSQSMLVLLRLQLVIAQVHQRQGVWPVSG